MHRLGPEPGFHGRGGGARAAPLEHVLGQIDAIDVQPLLEERHQQAARATGEVERGFPEATDRLAVEGQLGRLRLLAQPPARHETVVPGATLEALGRVRHGLSFLQLEHGPG